MKFVYVFRFTMLTDMLTKSLPQVILESHFDMWEFGGNFHDDACCILSFSFVFILFSVVIFFFTW